MKQGSSFLNRATPAWSTGKRRNPSIFLQDVSRILSFSSSDNPVLLEGIIKILIFQVPLYIRELAHYRGLERNRSRT